MKKVQSGGELTHADFVSRGFALWKPKELTGAQFYIMTFLGDGAKGGRRLCSKRWAANVAANYQGRSVLLLSPIT